MRGQFCPTDLRRGRLWLFAAPTAHQFQLHKVLSSPRNRAFGYRTPSYLDPGDLPPVTRPMRSVAGPPPLKGAFGGGRLYAVRDSPIMLAGTDFATVLSSCRFPRFSRATAPQLRAAAVLGLPQRPLLLCTTSRRIEGKSSGRSRPRPPLPQPLRMAFLANLTGVVPSGHRSRTC